MSRPRRIELEGGFYHVMARGNARQRTFLDDGDRKSFIDNLGRIGERFDRATWAWYLMDNHYLLLIETRQPTLSKGMREMKGVHTQAFNRRHRRAGHVLQGRYKAMLVDQNAYLLELARCVVLNPVGRYLVHSAGESEWSSYKAVMGKMPRYKVHIQPVNTRFPRSQHSSVCIARQPSGSRAIKKALFSFFTPVRVTRPNRKIPT